MEACQNGGRPTDDFSNSSNSLKMFEIWMQSALARRIEQNGRRPTDDFQNNRLILKCLKFDYEQLSYIWRLEHNGRRPIKDISNQFSSLWIYWHVQINDSISDMHGGLNIWRSLYRRLFMHFLHLKDWNFNAISMSPLIHAMACRQGGDRPLLQIMVTKVVDVIWRLDASISFYADSILDVLSWYSCM